MTSPPLDPAWVALSLVDHLGARRLTALAAHFSGDLNRAIAASEADLRQLRGIGPKLAAAVRAVDVPAVAAAILHWQSSGIRIFPLNAPDFPARLRQIADPPATLFVRGHGTFPTGRSVAIIGTRSPSPDARDAAQMIAVRLAERGCTVISGLALGIDAAAHLGALAVPTGRTCAILGGGLEQIYPPANRPLANAIALRGLLVTETHPLSEVSPQTLVARNRLISGLAEAVIVVQTGATGGAMHAARRALEQGRRLFTVDPARLTGDTSGNHALIAAGAASIAPDGADFPLI